jgi:hypothetical protein
MTRVAINNSIWTASLLLQGSLIALLFVRRVAWRIPSFTLLLIFYVMRSVALYFFSSHLAPPAYVATYNVLAIADLFLQLAVAIELELRLFPLPSGDGLPSQTLRRFGLLLTLPVLAFGATLLLSSSIPANAPIPGDRLQMFDAMFLVVVGVFAIARTSSRFLRRVITGLAVYGVVAVACSIGRTLAAVHRDSTSYLFWSYTVSIVWLLAVGFWVFALKPDPAPATLPEHE